MAPPLSGQVLLFEFKGVEMNPKGSAMQQIKGEGYSDKFRNWGEPISQVSGPHQFRHIEPD